MVMRPRRLVTSPSRSSSPSAIATQLRLSADHLSHSGRFCRSTRARRKPLKPLRRECRLMRLYLWRLRSCAFFISHARLWVRAAYPAFPVPSRFGGGLMMYHSGTTAARLQWRVFAMTLLGCLTFASSAHSGSFRYSRLARLASSRSRSRSIRRRISSVILPSRSRAWMNLRSVDISSRVSSLPVMVT